jgi:hypothetical protein
MPPRTDLSKLIKNCLFCGKPFRPRKPKAKFCCDKHRVYYSRKLKKEAIENLKATPDVEFLKDLAAAEYDLSTLPIRGQATLRPDGGIELHHTSRSFEPVSKYELKKGDSPAPQEDPPDLSGMELLAWRNEHRKTPE